MSPRKKQNQTLPNITFTDPFEGWIERKTLTKILGIKNPTYLAQLAHMGQGPEFVVVRNRALYDPKVVQTWLDGRAGGRAPVKTQPKRQPKRRPVPARTVVVDDPRQAQRELEQMIPKRPDSNQIMVELPRSDETKEWMIRTKPDGSHEIVGSIIRQVD